MPVGEWINDMPRRFADEIHACGRYDMQRYPYNDIMLCAYL